MNANASLTCSARGAFLALLFICGVHARADDAFLKVETIPGESVDAAHPNEIQALSYSSGVTTPVSFGAGGLQTGKAIFKDVTITKYLDKATPKLMLAAASGQHLKLVVLTVRRSGMNPFEYLKITLTDAVVTSVSDSGSTPERAAETVSFAYSKIAIDYTPQKPDGSPDAVVHFGWDLTAGTGF